MVFCFLLLSQYTCFHNGNTINDGYFKHSLFASMIKLYLQSQSATDTCSCANIWEGMLHQMTSLPYGYYGCWDIFRHSFAARLKLFVIKRWSPRRKEGEANQNSSNSQSFQPSLRADIDRQWCVCQFVQSFISCAQTERHPQREQGGKGESLVRSVEDRRGVRDGSGYREKCNGREIDEYTDTGEMKLQGIERERE